MVGERVPLAGRGPRARRPAGDGGASWLRPGRLLLAGAVLCLLLAVHLVLEHAAAPALGSGAVAAAPAQIGPGPASADPAGSALDADIPGSPLDGHVAAAVCSLLLAIAITVLVILRRRRIGEDVPLVSTVAGGVTRRGPPAPARRAMLCIDRT